MSVSLRVQSQMKNNQVLQAVSRSPLTANAGRSTASWQKEHL